MYINIYIKRTFPVYACDDVCRVGTMVAACVIAPCDATSRPYSVFAFLFPPCFRRHDMVTAGVVNAFSSYRVMYYVFGIAVHHTYKREYE